MMKAAPFLTAVCLLLFACNPIESSDQATKDEHVSTTDALEPKALQQLLLGIDKYRGPRTAPVLKDDHIEFADSKIYLKIKTEHELVKDTKHIYAAAYTLTYTTDRSHVLAIGSIGIGDTAGEASDISLKEWLETVGRPFVKMLGEADPITVNNVAFYPGLMGTRGDLPKDTWITDKSLANERILSAIMPSVVSHDREIFGIDIKLLLDSTGLKGGECRIGDSISPSTLQQLQTLDWPASEKSCIIKQYYIVNRRAHK